MCRYSTFQSTCLREARPRLTPRTTTGINFNPRAYVRHDAVVVVEVDRLIISIHVPT